MTTQRPRRRSAATLIGSGDRVAHDASPTLGRELLAKVAAGTRSFAAADRESAASVEAFQQQVRALESMAAEGMITIGAREMADQSTDVVAIRRIRLTEVGKRRANPDQAG